MSVSMASNMSGSTELSKSGTVRTSVSITSFRTSTAEAANPINAQGFNEGRQKYSAADIRFNKKGDKVLYVTLLGVPEGDVTIKALGSKTTQNSRKIKSVSLLGSGEKLAWSQSKENLTITRPADVPSPEAIVFKVTFR